MVKQIYEMSVSEILEAYSTNKLTRRQVIEAQLARIDETNPAVNGVIYRFDENALREADEADRETGDRSHLPLDGIPVTVSEWYSVKDCPEPWGMPGRENDLAEADDFLVDRIRKAGAIIVGKTSIPEGFIRWNSVSTLFGETRSARDISCAAGGSGGGAATAVAAGMVPLAFHADGGGSLRVPASWCGVLTMRTSPGVVPLTAPIDPLLSWATQTSCGPFARTFDDLWLATRVLAGPHPSHPRAITADILSESQGTERPRRIALLNPEAVGATVEAEVMEQVKKTAQAFVEAGYEVVEVDPPVSLKEVPDLWNAIWGMPFIHMVDGDLGDLLSDGVRHYVNRIYGPHDLGTDLRPWLEVEKRLWVIEREMGEFMAEYPLILSPVTGYRRPPIDYDYDLTESGGKDVFDHMRCTVWVNALTLPAVALGNGAELVGRKWYDAEVASASADVLKQLDPIQVAQPHEQLKLVR